MGVPACKCMTHHIQKTKTITPYIYQQKKKEKVSLPMILNESIRLEKPPIRDQIILTKGQKINPLRTILVFTDTSIDIMSFQFLFFFFFLRKKNES